MVAAIANIVALLCLAATAAAAGQPGGGAGGRLCAAASGAGGGGGREQRLEEEMPATVALLQGSKTLHLLQSDSTSLLRNDGTSLLQAEVEPSGAVVTAARRGEDSGSSSAGPGPGLLWIRVPRTGSGPLLGLLERQRQSSGNGGAGGAGNSSEPGQPGGARPAGAAAAAAVVRRGLLDAVAWDRHRGSLAAMFRRPFERMHSSWAWHAAANASRGVNVSRPRAYARQATGLATKILAGQWTGEPCSSTEQKDGSCPPPQRQQPKEAPKLALALARLDGFRFVGLTEEHSLSVCLFHAMFGGECLPSDFEPMQRGGYEQSTPEVARFFQGFIDPYDEAVHQKASGIFWRSVRSYNVSAESCSTSVCPLAAKYFQRRPGHIR